MNRSYAMKQAATAGALPIQDLRQKWRKWEGALYEVNYIGGLFKWTVDKRRGDRWVPTEGIDNLYFDNFWLALAYAMKAFKEASLLSQDSFRKEVEKSWAKPMVLHDEW